MESNNKNLSEKYDSLEGECYICLRTRSYGMSRDIRTREELDSIFTQRENNNDIYLVGAGYYGKTVGAYLNTQKRVWSGYVDKKKRGKK